MITINNIRNAKIGDKIVSGNSMIGSSGFGEFEAIIRKISKNYDKVYLEIVKNDYCLNLVGKKCWYDFNSFLGIFAIIPQQIPQNSNSNFETEMKKNIEKMRNELSQMENSLKEFQKNNVHKNPELEVGKMYRMIKDSYSGDSYYFYPVGFASGGPIAFTSQHKSDTYYIDIFNDIFEICTDPEMLKIQDSFNKFVGH